MTDRIHCLLEAFTPGTPSHEAALAAIRHGAWFVVYWAAPALLASLAALCASFVLFNRQEEPTKAEGGVGLVLFAVGAIGLFPSTGFLLWAWFRLSSPEAALTRFLLEALAR